MSQALGHNRIKYIGNLHSGRERQTINMSRIHGNPTIQLLNAHQKHTCVHQKIPAIVQSSTICNSPKLDATQMSINS